MLKNIWKYSGQYRKYLAALPFVVTLEALFEVYIPYLMADILDQGITGQDIRALQKDGLIMVALSVLLVFTGFLQSYLKSVWNAGVTGRLRHSLLEKIQQLSAADIDRIGKASLVTRISTDMNYIRKAFGMINSLIKCPVMILLTVVMTSRISLSLTWIFAAMVPVFAIVIFVITWLARRHYRKMFVHYDGMNTVLEEDVTGVRTIRAYNREDREGSRFTEAARNVFSQSYAAERITALNNPVLQLAVNSCILILVFLGGGQIIRGSLEAGDLFCMITYTNQILAQVLIIALILVPILSAQVSLERVFEVLSATPSLEDAGADPGLFPADGSVEFADVSFGYYGDRPEKYVLEHIDFQVPAGSCLGIIGASGSGKTTLIDLIPRFYDAVEGAVRVGGRDVRDYTLKQLRASIGIVPQASILFSGTIRENLLFGNENATEEDMIAACRAADAYDFIERFPDGFDTVISEGGTSVSGGQRQRLCIARALIRKPKILILDDSLSAVDTLTDARIRQALSAGFPHMTRIIIAQRIASLSNASRILVLDNGRAGGIGTHEELLAGNAVYREMNASQSRMME